MLLDKDFLLNAIPYAKFYASGVELIPDRTVWDFFNVGKEVDPAFDSRSATKDSIFFALKGQNFDGHDFLNQALKNGSCTFVVSKLIDDCLKDFRQDIKNCLIIVVPDTYKALVDLAKAWRTVLNCQVIGITGSIGKTSTKEILRLILQEAGLSFYVSVKNQNTFIGICVNILNVKQSCKVAVFEVAISEPGEMEQKADILRPTIGLITRVSNSHMAQLETLRKVTFEKCRLFKNFKDSDIGVIFGDQPLLTSLNYSHPIAKFGLKIRNNVHARKIKIVANQNGKFITEFTLKWYGKIAKIRFNSIHHGLICNALAASTIAYFLNVPFEDVVRGITNYNGFDNRFEQRDLKSKLGIVISDCYNANPESMRTAIQTFDNMCNEGRKIVVIGDMLELGEREVYWHRQIGKVLNKTLSISSVILVGELVKYTSGVILPGINISMVKNWQEARDVLNKQITSPGNLVLVKASRGISLDKVVSEICE